MQRPAWRDCIRQHIRQPLRHHAAPFRIRQTTPAANRRGFGERGASQRQSTASWEPALGTAARSVRRRRRAKSLHPPALANALGRKNFVFCESCLASCVLRQLVAYAYHVSCVFEGVMHCTETLGGYCLRFAHYSCGADRCMRLMRHCTMSTHGWEHGPTCF